MTSHATECDHRFTDMPLLTRDFCVRCGVTKPARNEELGSRPERRTLMSEKIPTAFGMVTPAPEPIIPGEWMQDIAAWMLRNTEESIRRSYMLQGVDPDNRPTVGVRVPRPAEFLARREDFATRWEALVTEGLEEGYLGYEHCYECGFGITTDTYTVESRPNPDYDPDKPNPYAQDSAEDGMVTVTIPARAANNVIIRTGDTR